MHRMNVCSSTGPPEVHRLEVLRGAIAVKFMFVKDVIHHMIAMHDSHTRSLFVPATCFQPT